MMRKVYVAVPLALALVAFCVLIGQQGETGMLEEAQPHLDGIETQTLKKGEKARQPLGSEIRVFCPDLR